MIPSTSPALEFAPSPGWRTTTLDHTAPLSERVLWATNAPVRALDPVDTVKELASRGIVVWVASILDTTAPGGYPERDLPLQLTDCESHWDMYEGQPAPHVSMYGPLLAHVEGQYLEVCIWFGTNYPTDSMLAEARAALARLRVKQEII